MSTTRFQRPLFALSRLCLVLLLCSVSDWAATGKAAQLAVDHTEALLGAEASRRQLAPDRRLLAGDAAPGNDTKTNATNTTNTTKNSSSLASNSSSPAKAKDTVKPVPPPSKVAPLVELSRYYAGSIHPNQSAIAQRYRHARYFHRWRDFNMTSYWQYYTIDVKELLGREFKITDENHALNKLDGDLKIAGVSQFKDLIFETLTDDDGKFADPDVYINLNDTRPDLWRHDHGCTVLGNDLCIVSGKDIEERKVTHITVGIFCFTDCKFKIQAELDAEIIMDPGKMNKIYFKANQQRIFKFRIPDSSEIEQIEIKGINENKFAKWDMFVLQGNVVPDTSKAIKLESAWENGYIGLFKKHCFCFCTNCNYTVLITAKESGYITIGAKTSNSFVDLKSFPGGTTYDTVYFWGTTCYKYMVTDGDKDFRVRLESYSGNPDAYVNPKYPLTYRNLSRAMYNSKDHFWNEELVLDPSTRAKHGGSTGLYYVCVYGSTGSNYKISAKNEDHSIMLKAGLSESGYVEKGEIKQFYFTDNLLMDPKARVKVNGHLMSGSFRLVAKLCPKPKPMSTLQEDCSLSEAEMMKLNPKEKIVRSSQGYEIEKPDHNICAPNEGAAAKLNSKAEAQCIYVIGIIGVSEYTTHFSVMVELQDPAGRHHPVLLSEGVPSINEVKPKKHHYYQISIDDPDIVKLTIQLTTLHGNPNMYVSTREDNKTPDVRRHDRASRMNGFYPDIIVFEKTARHNLTHDFYVGIQSYEDSTYNLVYFTETKNGQMGIQKLMIGKKQKGIINILRKNLTHPSSPVLDQPSLVYHFAVSSRLFKDKKEIDIRLNAEHGSFVYIVQQKIVPDIRNVTFFERVTRWMGDESHNVRIKHEALKKDEEAFEKDKAKSDKLKSRKGHKEKNEELINFYIRVYPNIVQKDLDDNDTQPHVFDIAFYDELSLIQLVDGHPVRGVVSNQTFDYYYYDIDDLKYNYEIALEPISGCNPDLVFSLNSDNKFPTREKYDHISEQKFTTDSIIITNASLTAASSKGLALDGKMQTYIGVYSQQPLCIYSLLMTKMVDFKPIKLVLGQLQAGVVVHKKTKYYSVKVTKADETPFELQLIPKNGNLRMELTIINDLHESLSVWQDKIKKPDTTFNQIGNTGLQLNPSWFIRKCKDTCIVLIGVMHSDEELKYHAMRRGNATPIHYKLQVSQEFKELVENHYVESEIKSMSYTNETTESQIDHSRYKFFKFYKTCGQECDLVFDVAPHGVHNKVLSVLINYQDPRDMSKQGTKLPTWKNDPQWQVSIKWASQITIEGTEPYFDEHEKIHKRTAWSLGRDVSAGYYIIGIHSFEDMSFSITAKIKKRSDAGDGRTPLDIQQIYQGKQDHVFYLLAGEAKYFYFQNWRNDDLQFKIQNLHRRFRWQKNIHMAIGKLEKDWDDNSQGGSLPIKYVEDLDGRWKPQKVGFNIGLPTTDDDFCLFCTYLIEIKNNATSHSALGNSRKGDARFRLVVEQKDQDFQVSGEDVKKEAVFKGQLRLGEPRPVELDEGQTVFLVLQDRDPANVTVDIELLLGDANITLYRTTDNKEFFQYPCPKNASHHIKDNIVMFNLSHELRQDKGRNGNHTYNNYPYALKIRPTSKVFEAVVYLKKEGSLDIIGDGATKKLDYVYDMNGAKEFETKVNYFIFLPSSHELELQLNAQLTKMQSDVGTYNYKGDGISEVRDGVEADDDQGSGTNRKFFSFKVALKKLQLINDLKGKDVQWKEEYVKDEQFDYVMKSSETSDEDKLFKMVGFETNPKDDIILVRTEGIFDKDYAEDMQYAMFQYSLKISSSDVSYLAPGETTRAVVSDGADRFKIFEFYINKRQYHHALKMKKKDRNSKVDLFIQMTPCTGLLEFYISDKYENLFKETSIMQNIADQNSLLDSSERVEIQHKRSKVRATKYGRSKNLALDLYEDDFGIQGKRLKNINQLHNKKIYIGVKTLNEAERQAILDKREHKEIEMTVEKKEAHFHRHHRERQFKPMKSKFTHSTDGISTFEIKASYIETEKPDILDMYRIENDEYGIRIDKAGKEHRHMASLSWSPIQMLNENSIKNENGVVDQSNWQYDVVPSGVTYKLYLGYKEEAIDMFSSLCQMEAYKNSEPVDNRRLRARRPVAETDDFLQVTDSKSYDSQHGEIKVLTVQDQTEINLQWREYFHHLETAVVIAFIRDEKDPNKLPITLAYAPVQFAQEYESPGGDRKLRWAIVVIALCAFICCSVGVVWCYQRRLIGTIQKNFEKEVQNKGIAMKSIPSSTQNTSMQGSDSDRSKASSFYKEDASSQNTSMGSEKPSTIFKGTISDK